ncbi:MAG: DUF4177 domain-containing protein [Methanomassiliicoccaceae archaeon]|jgi:hypothetical protein|nr:DUF4177 domain-containing protein [Methanomassiliicoccaceae archaeon]
MAEYRSEIVKVAWKMWKSSIREEERNELDILINQRASEGWELVAYTFMGGGQGGLGVDMGRGILITFKRG